MKTSPLSVALAVLALALFAVSGHAEEKNGLSVTVAKVTLEKNDKRSTSTYSKYERINRTQALKVTVKNVSFKPMPEGELDWKILVVGSYSSQISSGSEKVKALKPAESHDLTIGNAEVSGWRDGNSKAVDKIEWQLTVKQGDTEIIRSQTIPNFDALAKRAYTPYDKKGGAWGGKDGGRDGKDGR